MLVNGWPAGSFGLMIPATKAPDTLEIGYWLGATATGRGLATRAAGLLTKVAFEMGASHVQIRHDKDNVRSGAIPRRLGFEYLGIRTLPVGVEGENVTSSIWQKDRDAVPDKQQSLNPDVQQEPREAT